MGNSKSVDKESNVSRSFSQELDSLEELVAKMEREDLSLEDSIKSYELGIKSLSNAKSILLQAEQVVSTISPSRDRAPETAEQAVK